MRSLSPFFQKVCITLALLVLMAPGVFLLFQPKEQVEGTGLPVADFLVGSLHVERKISEGIAEGINAAGYGVVRSMLNSWAQAFAVGTFNLITAGGAGQGPLYETRTGAQVLEDIKAQSSGFFIEGFASGYQDRLNRDNMVARNNKLLNERCASDIGLQTEECARLYARTVADTEAFDAQRDVRMANGLLTGNGVPGVQNVINAICFPNVNFSLQLFLPSLGVSTRGPVCNFGDIVNNWQGVLQRTGISDALAGNFDGWRALQNMIQPNSNDLGFAFSFYYNQYDLTQQDKEKTMLKLLQEYPLKPKTDLIGNVLTPSNVLADMVARAQAEGTDVQKVLTGHLIADTVATFVGTLSQRMMALAAEGIRASGSPNLSSLTAARYAGSSEQTRNLAKLTSVSFSAPDDINGFAELQSADCDNGGMNACVMSSALAAAVKQRMTLEEAVKAFTATNGNVGIRYDAIFGFDFDSQEPQPKNFTDGDFPYRALVILRKFRVVPVSWELAALYIRDNKDACTTRSAPKRSCTIGFLMDNYANKIVDGRPNPFYGLVDPSWVLKLPAARCELKGYGAELYPLDASTSVTRIQYDTNHDGKIVTSYSDCGCAEGDSACERDCHIDVQTPSIQRREVCLEQTSCLSDDKNGNCISQEGDANRGYGHCLEEKKVWQFEGSSCRPEYNSCQTFVTPEGRQVSYIANDLFKLNTLLGEGQCKADVAGCRWYSAQKNFTSSGDVSLPAPWKSGDGNKVYLSSRAQACTQSDEGCSALTDTNGQTIYMKIAPAYYPCDGSQASLARPECQKFARQCKSEHQGCRGFTPTAGGPQVAAKAFGSCTESCVGMTAYTQVATEFDRPAPLATIGFIARHATQCNAQAVGCDQYTDLDATTGAESVMYFSRPQRCVVRDASSPVFYSWEGDGSTGYRLVSYSIMGDPVNGPALGVSDPDAATCNASTYAAQAAAGTLHPEGRVCKQFFTTTANASNSVSPFYRYADNLIYATDEADCRTYRNENTTDKVTLRVSKSLSRTCTAAENLCRAYRSPEAGNVEVLVNDTFEGSTASGWGASVQNTSLDINTEASFAAGHSVVLARANGKMQKVVVLGSTEGAYILQAQMKKASANDEVRISILDGVGREHAITTSKTVVTTGWQIATVSGVIPAGLTTPTYVQIESVTGSTLSFDWITLKRTPGVVYAIKDSWVGKMDASCTLANSLGCAAYRDDQGAAVYAQRFDGLCPAAFVGCTQYTTPASSTPLYYVADRTKQCQSTNVGCTAYGLPMTDALGVQQKDGLNDELWETKYFKISSQQITQARSNPTSDHEALGICTAKQQGCAAFKAQDLKGGSVDMTMRDPATLGVVVQDNNGVWEPKVCSRGSDPVKKADGTLIVCTDGGNQCNTSAGETCVALREQGGIVTDTVNANLGLVRTCPASQNTCRQVTDPFCRNGVLVNDYGRGTTDGANIPCTTDYYRLNDAVTNSAAACNGQVDPSKGCILFKDTLVASSDTRDANGNVKTPYASFNAYKGVPVPLNAASVTAGGDGNRVIKVTLDRQCNIWLSCSVSFANQNASVEALRNICVVREPCLDGTSTNCTRPVTEADKSKFVNLHGVISTPMVDSNRSLSSFYAAYLSGISRPDFRFIASSSTPLSDTAKCAGTGDSLYCTTGGHDGFFDWKQREMGDTEDSTRGLFGFSQRPISYLLGALNRSTVALESAFKDGRNVTNSCRMYPSLDTPPDNAIFTSLSPTVNDRQPVWTKLELSENRQVARPALFDGCYYRDQNLNLSLGLYGFCLEPDPRADTTSFISSVGLPTGFSRSCLTWYPAIGIKGQTSVLNQDPILPVAKGPKYMCLQGFGGKSGINGGASSYTVVVREQIEPVVVNPGTGVRELPDRSFNKMRIVDNPGIQGKDGVSTIDEGWDFTDRQLKTDYSANLVERSIYEDQIASIEFDIKPTNRDWDTAFKNNSIRFTYRDQNPARNFLLFESVGSDSNVNENNIFTEDNSINRAGVQVLGVQPQFHPETRVMTGWKVRYFDHGRVGNFVTEGMTMKITIHLKDFCKVLVQVVTPSDESVPYYAYTMNPNTQGTSGGPLFSARPGTNTDFITPPQGVEQDPALWADRLLVPPVGGVPTGIPLQFSNARPRYASAQAIGLALYDPAEAGLLMCKETGEKGQGSREGKACVDQPGACGQGYCGGNVQRGAASAAEALDQIFANYYRRIYGVWEWNQALRRYVPRPSNVANVSGVATQVFYLSENLSTPLYYDAEAQRLARRSPAWATIPARIAPQVKILNADKGVIASNATAGVIDAREAANRFVRGRKVELSFYVEVNPNTQPLKRIEIDWGDGTTSSVPLNSAGRPESSGNPYTGFSNIYTSTSINRATIKVKATDNWGGVGEATLQINNLPSR